MIPKKSRSPYTNDQKNKLSNKKVEIVWRVVAAILLLIWGGLVLFALTQEGALTNPVKAALVSLSTFLPVMAVLIVIINIADYSRMKKKFKQD